MYFLAASVICHALQRLAGFSGAGVMECEDGEGVVYHGYWEPLSALGCPVCVHQVPNNWCLNAIRNFWSRCVFISAWKSYPKSIPSDEWGRRGGVFSRGGALKHLSEVTDFEEPNLLERTQTPHPHSSMDQPDVELKTKILSHEANLKPGQFASWYWGSPGTASAWDLKLGRVSKALIWCM